MSSGAKFFWAFLGSDGGGYLSCRLNFSVSIGEDGVSDGSSCKIVVGLIIGPVVVALRGPNVAFFKFYFEGLFVIDPPKGHVFEWFELASGDKVRNIFGKNKYGCGLENADLAVLTSNRFYLDLGRLATGVA